MTFAVLTAIAAGMAVGAILLTIRAIIDQPTRRPYARVRLSRRTTAVSVTTETLAVLFIGDYDGWLKVRLPSGCTVDALTEGEKDYLTERVAQHERSRETSSSIDHVLRVDRLLVMELLCYRWSLWILNGEDYDKAAIDETALRKALSECSAEIRHLKQLLGLDPRRRW